MIDSLAQQYTEYNNKKKKFDNKRKEIADKIDEQLEVKGVDKINTDNYSIYKVENSKKEIDEEKLLEVIKDHNINAVKKSPDIEQLEKMIDNNELSQDILKDINGCINTKKWDYVRVKETN